MKINDKDFDIVDAFLRREAAEFPTNWKLYNSLIKQQIDDGLKAIPGADYLHIESMTNVGLVSRRLTLTPVPWSTGVEVYIYLPPAPPPRGKVHIQVKKKGQIVS